MQKFVYSELERLVGTEDYQAAISYCQAAIGGGRDRRFWETQLGYVYFLNERDAQSFYILAQEVFESLVTSDPTDVNAHFWLGYIYDVVLSKLDSSVRELRQALALDEDHPYANLALSALVERTEGIQLLERTVERQPFNYRALSELADELLQTGNIDESRSALETMLMHDAYVEQGYGVMNDYINRVLTQSARKSELRDAAQMKLRKLSGPHLSDLP